MIINRSIFKAYDIRGIYPTDINPETIITIGKACAHMFNPGVLVIAYDARYGSPELAKALEEAIIKEAGNIDKIFTFEQVGLSTTPMFYFLVNHHKASGGCMITASHNPKNYNGIKMVKEGAEPISGVEILNLIDKLNS